jgi:hypothetical protein
MEEEKFLGLKILEIGSCGRTKKEWKGWLM